MTASVNYYPHRLLEYGGRDCHYAAGDSTELSSSIAMILVALAASEVVILVLCKAMAWYADLVFYSQDWNTSTGEENGKLRHRSPETIAQSLHTFQYERRSCAIVSEEESTCPICLVEFETNDLVSHGKASCHHRFHQQCISEWLSKHSTCPCCRQDMIVASPPPPICHGSPDAIDPQFCLFVF